MSKVIEGDDTGIVLGIMLALDGKALDCDDLLRLKGTIDSTIPGSTLHSCGIVDGRHKLDNPLFI